jgi:predicted enzyme related to lactoylglutathione lyase
MQVDKHDPGLFCWVELGTTDQSAAKKFYSGLFGWTINDMPMGPDSFYTILQLKGRDVAALYQLNAQQKEQGITPHWLLYISAENADAAAAAVKASGGALMMEPFDVFDVGRMFVAQDPAGATFAVWQPRAHIGVRVKNENNAFCWAELATRDPAKAEAFYTKAFGWEPQHKDSGPMKYTEFYLAGRVAEGAAVGGMYSMLPEMEGVPPHWATYFAVDDCDGYAEKAKSLGGNLIVPPHDIPGVGRFSAIADPQGATFSIIKLNN